MKRELIVINVVLVLALVGAGFELRRGWLDFEATHDVSRIQFEGDPLGAPAAPESTGAPIEDWILIAEQNLFSFDRNDLAIQTAEVLVAAGPRPFLFGTVSLGAEPLAMLGTGNGGDRAYQPMKVGEVIDGWELVEIFDKSVQVRSEGVEVTVIMNDPTADAPRVANRTIARSGATPQVATVRAPTAAVQSGVNRSAVARPTNPNPSAVTPDNVPPGFMIQKTPFGNRLVPKPQP